jgi:hypothetical protein
VKLTTHHCSGEVKNGGAVTHLPNTPSWRGAQLKHRDTFAFTYTFTLLMTQSGSNHAFREPGWSVRIAQMRGMFTNDVSDYINLLVRIAHIICNHPYIQDLERKTFWTVRTSHVIFLVEVVETRWNLEDPKLK